MYESFTETGTFEGQANPNLRVMIGLYYNPNQVVVAKNSNINSSMTLQANPLPAVLCSSTTEVETAIHLKESGINYPDALKVSTSASPGDRSDAQQADRRCLDHGGHSKRGGNRDALHRRRKASPLDPRHRFPARQAPAYAAYTIPANTYPGQDEDVLTSAIKLTICTDARVSAM